MALPCASLESVTVKTSFVVDTPFLEIVGKYDSGIDNLDISDDPIFLLILKSLTCAQSRGRHLKDLLTAFLPHPTEESKTEAGL